MKFYFNLQDDGNIGVTAEKPECKKSPIVKVATIHEPDNENPMLQMHTIFGIKGTQKLISEFTRWKKERE